MVVKIVGSSLETKEEQPKYLSAAQTQWVPNYSLSVEGLPQNKGIIKTGSPA